MVGGMEKVKIEMPDLLNDFAVWGNPFHGIRARRRVAVDGPLWDIAEDATGGGWGWAPSAAWMRRWA